MSKEQILKVPFTVSLKRKAAMHELNVKKKMLAVQYLFSDITI